MKRLKLLPVGALTCALVACATNAPAPNAPRCATSNVSRFGVANEPLDLKKLLGPLPARSAVPPNSDLVLVASGAMVAGDHLDSVLAVPEKDCGLVMARGSATASDLDLFAYTDDGAVLGSDQNGDATPVLLVCPPHPARFLVSARVVKGHGLVAVGAQRLSPPQAAETRRSLGLEADAPLGEPSDERWPDLAERLAAHRELLGGEWDTPNRRILPADSRLPTHVSANVSRDRCVDALILPDARVGHLDVAILDLEGRTLGRGAATGRERFATVCSGRDTGFTLRVHPQSGHGTVALVLSRSMNEGASAFDVPTIQLDPASTASLDVQSRLLAKTLEERGYRAKPAWRKVIRSKDVSVPPSLELSAGCHRLDLLAALPVRRLEASLWSADGRLLGTARGSVPLELVSCTERMNARLELRPEPMSSDVAVELRSVADISGALRASPLAASRLASRMLGRGVIRSMAQLTHVDTLELDAASRVSVPLALPVGRCVDATIALGAGGARGVEIGIRDQRTGAQLAFARGAVSAAARACTLGRPESLAVSVEVRTLWGAGPALFAARMLAPNP